MLLRQTVESPDRKRLLQTGDSSTPVDLGSYSQLIHNGATEQPLKFKIDWKRDSPLELIYPINSSRFTGTQLSFHASISSREGLPPRVRVDEYGYDLFSPTGQLALSIESAREKEKYNLTATGIELKRSLGRKWPLSAPSQFHAFPDDIFTRYQGVDFTADLTLSLEEQLSHLNYLGPLRQKPNRLYRWSGEEVSDVGWSGEKTIDALLAGAQRRYNSKPKERTRTLPETVAYWLTRLGVVESFSVEPIGEGRDEYEVRVTVTKGGRSVLLTDVGFGVSQVLPVIVESFYAEPGSTGIMEQPEIHLHPSVQAGLADLLIDAALSRENGKERKTQFIIESHSEYLLRRLLRRIAEGDRISSKDVRCYIVDNSDSGSVISPLQVDELGNVHNWPKNFFGDPNFDIIEQTRAARRRR